MIADGKSSSGGTVTQQEIAERLGVSRQLVTHVLNKTHRTRISPEMRRKIEETAREMNYRPRRLTTHNIGYPLPASELFLEPEHVFALRVEQVAREAGYRLIIVRVPENSTLDSLAETFNPKTVDGVISPRWFNGQIQRVLPAGIPLVLVADDDIPAEVDVICTDARATLRSMTQHLLDYGHRRIGVVLSAADEIKQHRDICQGCLDAMRHNGLPHENLIAVRGAIEEVVPVLKDTLAWPDAPTAWIASSPMYATAISCGLYAQGYSIPQTASVMSFFDSRLFAALPMPLTATTAFGTEIAEKAVHRLIARIEGDVSTPLHQRIEAKIIERASVCPPLSTEIR